MLVSHLVSKCNKLIIITGTNVINHLYSMFVV